MPASDTEPGWAAVVVNYEAGEALRECVRSLLDDTSAGRPPEVVVVDNGSSDGSAAAVARRVPGRDRAAPGREPRLRPAANLGIAATDAPVVAVCNPDLEVEPERRRRCPGAPARDRARPRRRRPADPQPRRDRLPVGPLAIRRCGTRSVTGCSGSSGRTNRSPGGTASSMRTRAAPRRRLGLGRGGLAAARRARRRSAAGTSGTSCTSRTSTCAGGSAAAAGGSGTSRGRS